MTSWIIRTPRESDFDGFYETFDIVAREKKYFSFTTAPPKEGLRKYLSRVIEKGLPFFVLESEGSFKGWAEAVPMSGQSGHHNGIFSIALRPEARNFKQGPPLATMVINESIKFGFKYLRADVFSENEKAINLYLKLGFTIDGERQGLLKIDDTLHSIRFLTLDLGGK